MVVLCGRNSLQSENRIKLRNCTEITNPLKEISTSYFLDHPPLLNN